MRRWFAVIALLLASVLAWSLLGFCVHGASERFYLLLPPVLLALLLVRAPGGWARLRPHVRPLLTYVAGLLALCTAFGLIVVAGFRPAVSATTFWNVVVELSIAVYFLMAVMLLLGAALAGVNRLVQAPAANGRKVLWRLLPLALLVPLVFPYLIATLYVHRFKVPNADPSVVLAGRAFEDVRFTAADGLSLRGWFLPAVHGPSARTLLICHGIGANRSSFLPFVQVGDTLGANVLLFDFRGHGDSDGHTVSLGYHETLDVHAAIAYLRTERPEQACEIVGLGVSMGAAPLIRAAAELEQPLQGFILDSGFASAVELTDNVLTAFPAVVRPCLAGLGVPLASLDAGCWLPDVRPVDQIHRLRAPVMIIHAQDDSLIPADHARRLFEAAVEPKSLWIADTGDHCSAFGSRAEYLAHVSRLLTTPTAGK